MTQCFKKVDLLQNEVALFTTTICKQNHCAALQPHMNTWHSTVQIIQLLKHVFHKLLFVNCTTRVRDIISLAVTAVLAE